MKEETLKLTTGGMFVAIFAILLLVDRQTGNMFEELIMYLLPIPMVAYSAKWGFKTSLPVLIAMGLISLIFGNITTIFYAVSEAFIGMVFGGCINRKVDMTKTLLLVILLSVIANLLNTIIFASLFGYNLTAEMQEMKEMMISTYQTAYDKAGQDGTAFIQQLETIMTPQYLMRAMVVAMIVLGAAQGIIVYYISLLILNRLRFKLPKPQPLSEFYPPKWFGYLCGALYLLFIMSYGRVENELLDNIIQTSGMAAMFCLVFFGILGIMLICKRYVSPKQAIGVIIGILGMFMFSQIEAVIGLIYITSDYHAVFVQEIRNMQGK